LLVKKGTDVARRPEAIGDGLQPVVLSDTESSIIERLDVVVRSRPNSLAAHIADTDVTWAELDERSNALALRLHAALGSGPEPIAIVGVAGPDMVIAPLAILKSGRPYTWIDAALPISRALQIVSLSEARSAIIGSLSPELTNALGSAGLSLHRVGEDSAVNRPSISLDATNPVSVVFTSGSTGTPKGVITSHRYYILHAATCAERGIGPDDRVGLVIPMSFAYGAIVFWRTMLLGATIFPCDPRKFGIDLIPSWCSEHQIEVLDLTPSLLRALTRASTDPMDSLRIVECAGEPLFARDAANIRQHLPSPCVFRNGIGSSETGAYAFYQIPVLDHPSEGIVPVGTGTRHKEISIRDSEGNAVPPGSTGEIVVTSRFNANGYWGQPDLTARRFIVTHDGRTSYHTGDLGRWLPDGPLLHLGRSDGMVKIRGYLVEPAEVEAALLDTGLVHEAAAFGATDDQGRTSLYAYVVPIDGIRSSNAAIRRALRKRVPEYIVPTSLIAVPQLPKNDNNKIDRAQLRPVSERGANPAPPQGDWEQAVAQVWCTILGLDSIGVDDDFFSLGGDSLGVLELITAMAEDHGVTVHSSDLVECPTLGAFAERVRKPTNVRGRVLVPLQKGGTGPPLFCFAGGGGVAGDFFLLARYLDLDRPVYGLQAHGIEGGGIPDWTASRWAERCVRHIRKIQPHGPYCLAGHSFGGFLAWEAGRLLQDAGEEIALLVLIDPLSPNSTGGFIQMDGQTQPPPSRARSVKLPQSLRRVVRALVEFGTINLAGIGLKSDKERISLFYRHAQILFRRYQPSPWDGPTVVYMAETKLDGHERYDFEPLLRGPWEEHYRPGNHLTIMGEPYVESLAVHLRQRLAAPQTVGQETREDGVEYCEEQRGR
jgi:amino acid adenylation domain-containing protein